MQQTYPENPAVPPVVLGTFSGTTYRQPLPTILVVGNRQQLKAHVLEALAVGARDIVLDLIDCLDIDSSGLGVLVAISKKVREAGGQLQLVHVPEDIRTILEVSRLDTILAVLS
jgi:anti-sigma B factor antagonist